MIRRLKEIEMKKIGEWIARAIKDAGRKERITRTGELARIIALSVPRTYERGRIHPATRTFQAFRIYANHELENLERSLTELPQIVQPKGRAAIISFHSLEDRIVKNSFKKLEQDGVVKILTKKPIQAGERETKENPRSRSAKLRAAIVI